MHCRNKQDLAFPKGFPLYWNEDFELKNVVATVSVAANHVMGDVVKDIH
jgi:hypothetical protein